MAAQIFFLLDRSGSMEAIQKDVLSGYRDFLLTQQGSTLMTLFQFSNKMETTFLRKPIAEVQPLTPETFQPGGGTRLYDSIVEMIKIAERYREEGGKMVFVIFTDGLDNLSQAGGQSNVRELVQHCRKLGDEFIYMGANQDAIMIGSGLGADPTSAALFQLDRTPQALRSAGENVSRYFSGEASNTSFSTKQRRLMSREFR